MVDLQIFHEDVYFAFFKPFRHPSSQFNIWGGIGLETSGSDLKIVQDYPMRFVWTVIDGEGLDQWISPGFHHVNRVCYLLTEVAHEWAPVNFRVDRRLHSLTPLGLSRRITTLRRLMHQNAVMQKD